MELPASVGISVRGCGIGGLWIGRLGAQGARGRRLDLGEGWR